jgi:glutathione S-transferase
MLEELGLPYEVKRYARNPKTMLAPPELKAVHPLGKSPVIEHNGRVVAETATILEYLVALSAGRLGPPEDADGALRWRYFLDYAEGSLMPPLLLKLVIDRLGPLGWPAKGIITKMAMVHIDYVEAELTQRPWFTGRRRDDELPAGSRARPPQALRPPPDDHRMARPHPCAACLSGRIGEGRALQLRMRQDIWR